MFGVIDLVGCCFPVSCVLLGYVLLGFCFTLFVVTFYNVVYACLEFWLCLGDWWVGYLLRV